MAIIDPRTVRSSLSAHSVIGLVVGALMYLICLTGTVAVFADYFERWEQPLIHESRQFDPAVVATAMDNTLARLDEAPHHLYAVLPTDFLPRIHMAADDQEWWVNADGSLADEPVEGWTVMLRALHYHLLLPETLGFIVVSGLGAMLMALILSGVLAHPRIFRDAFQLRLGGSKRLEQADIHNRLSVWGLPFHVAIAITGAWFGLVGPLVFVAASAFYDGDTAAVFSEVYGSDPVIDAPAGPLGTDRAFAWMRDNVPEGSPLYLVVHDIGERNQYMEVAATLPGRLAYSEIYRFAADGSFLGHQGLTDGPAARQIAYSVYRVHFGHFGGVPVRIAYLVLGLALTVVSVTGVNVWLARRGRIDRLNDLWVACVWGSPFALVVAAFFSLLLGYSAGVGLLLGFVVSFVLTLTLRDVARVRRWLWLLTGAGLIVLVVAHFSLYPLSLVPAIVAGLNIALLFTGSLFVLAWRFTALETGDCSELPQRGQDSTA